jgi:translation initiation factor IF-2
LSGKKRIHELAKEWGLSTKDLVARLDRLGIRNKRSQSSLKDDEVARVRDALGLREKAAVAIGAERVVEERVVTEKDASEEQLVTSRERVVENRVGQNLIRRRTKKVEELKREDIPLAVPAAMPPLEPVEMPPVPSAGTVWSAPVETREVPPAPVVATASAAPNAEHAPEPPPAAAARPAAASVEAPPVSVPVKTPATAAAPEAPARPAPASMPPTMSGTDAPQTVRVLGKIDLKKAMPPRPGPRRTTPAERPGTVARPDPNLAVPPDQLSRGTDAGRKK